MQISTRGFEEFLEASQKKIIVYSDALMVKSTYLGLLGEGNVSEVTKAFKLHRLK
ncbi:hypothetical protein SERLA73DRAFT_189411 [Serpula lacrymans var. lacrymans S7.3]|uniref:Uncharacterized protein n=1 Tax=Serpula lacrymans var. lacrymans (strain S7.3) TaxID=936435 RepID=F8QDK8_SERL3|nr:hypothetical protein SERLA73DRAFT_189411 [Serpula lacrymans var. lacrymans S7.3]